MSKKPSVLVECAVLAAGVAWSLFFDGWQGGLCLCVGALISYWQSGRDRERVRIAREQAKAEFKRDWDEQIQRPLLVPAPFRPIADGRPTEFNG